jgi:hypothetical protein
MQRLDKPSNFGDNDVDMFSAISSRRSSPAKSSKKSSPKSSPQSSKKSSPKSSPQSSKKSSPKSSSRGSSPKSSRKNSDMDIDMYPISSSPVKLMRRNPFLHVEIPVRSPSSESSYSKRSSAKSSKKGSPVKKSCFFKLIEDIESILEKAKRCH